MFNFMCMQPQKVARFEQGDLIVDTCGGINDSSWSYETAVCHPEYNDGDWIIVEGYDTEADALAGHANWVKIMTANKMPVKLLDVSSATIAKLADELSTWREYPRTIDIKENQKLLGE
jgi:hypothetical protein